MRPGPRPQPVELKLLRGNPGKRRLPVHAVTPAAGAECPMELSRAAKAKWKRLAPELESLGTLKKIDEDMFACYCGAVADYFEYGRRIKREGSVITAGNGTRIPNPYVAMKRTTENQILKFSAEFGLSPASRAGLALPGPENEDDDDERFFGPRPTPAPRKS